MKSLFNDFEREIHRSSSTALIRGLLGPMYVTVGKDLSARAFRHTVVLCQPSRFAASVIVISMHARRFVPVMALHTRPC
jgi:hypothetical protein